jgi:hypothetical protein
MRKEGGQATVEFALVVGVLFLVVFGIIEFSRLFFAYATMSQGVREGARYGIVHPGSEYEHVIIDLVESRMTLIGGTATVTVDYPDESESGYPFCQHHCRIVVRATSSYHSWFPLVPDIEIVAQSTMHFE